MFFVFFFCLGILRITHNENCAAEWILWAAALGMKTSDANCRESYSIVSIGFKARTFIPPPFVNHG